MIQRKVPIYRFSGIRDFPHLMPGFGILGEKSSGNRECYSETGVLFSVPHRKCGLKKPVFLRTLFSRVFNFTIFLNPGNKQKSLDINNSLVTRMRESRGFGGI